MLPTKDHDRRCGVPLPRCPWAGSLVSYPFKTACPQMPRIQFSETEERLEALLCGLSIATLSPLQVRKEKVPTCRVPGVMAETGLEHVAA